MSLIIELKGKDGLCTGNEQANDRSISQYGIGEACIGKVSNKFGVFFFNIHAALYFIIDTWKLTMLLSMLTGSLKM